MNEKIPKIEASNKLSFAELAPDVWDKLSKLQRTGWVQRGVENPETVAEHTLALKRLGKTLGEFSETEREELLDMLEVHDWPEAVHGDEVILNDGDDEKYKSLKMTKFEKEQNALKSICEKMGDVGEIIFGLWMRFETSADELADFGRQLDKYQAVEKALEYEKEQGIALFREFFDYSKKYITHPILLERMQKLEGEWNTL